MDDSRLALKGADDDTDRGAVLLLVLAVAIVLSLVVLALANFVAADLRYSQVVDSRAKSLSSAESGIEYAVGRMRLNQTLCSSDLASAGPIGLNGAATPTELPATPLTPTEPLNGAVTTLTCERLSADFPGVAGWSVITTLASPDPIKVQVKRERTFTGPVFVTDPSNVVAVPPGELRISAGDLWYRNTGGCATLLPPADLTGRVAFDEPFVRGPICTTATWNQIVSAPPLPSNLGSLPSRGVDGVLDPDSCLVFEPGRYVLPPTIPSGSTVYLRSGEYLFEFPEHPTNDTFEEFLVTGVGTQVTVGQPDTAPLPSDACYGARLADFNDGGPRGATFYVDLQSRVRVDNGATLEMFPQTRGAFAVSIHQLDTSTLGIDGVLRTRYQNSRTVDVVVRGLVWAPRARVVLDNPHTNTVHWLLGGVVADRLWIGDLELPTLQDQDLKIEPAASATDAEILVRSKSTMNGVTTEVEAVVAYQPGATTLDDRVAVTSLRVVD